MIVRPSFPQRRPTAGRSLAGAAIALVAGREDAPGYWSTDTVNHMPFPTRDRLLAELEAYARKQSENGNSELERARRDYRKGKRYRRERRFDTIEKMLAADEADLDLAACALAIEESGERRDRHLEGLNRIACLVRRASKGSKIRRRSSRP